MNGAFGCGCAGGRLDARTRGGSRCPLHFSGLLSGRLAWRVSLLLRSPLSCAAVSSTGCARFALACANLTRSCCWPSWSRFRLACSSGRPIGALPGPDWPCARKLIGHSTATTRTIRDWPLLDSTCIAAYARQLQALGGATKGAKLLFLIAEEYIK